MMQFQPLSPNPLPTTPRPRITRYLLWAVAAILLVLVVLFSRQIGQLLNLFPSGASSRDQTQTWELTPLTQDNPDLESYTGVKEENGSIKLDFNPPQP